MVADSLELNKWYGLDSMDETLQELLGATDITVSQTGLIDLRVRDKDPEMASKITAIYISSLDSLNHILEFTRAGNTMKFIKEQLEEYRLRVKSIRDSIAEFQRINRVADFGEQTEGAIKVAVDLKLRQVLAGIELELIKEYSREKTLDFRRKRSEYMKLTGKLEEMAEGDASSPVFIPLKKLPVLKQQYATMKRDLDVAESVYSFLMERYEESGIEKARTTPSIQIISYPNIPDKSSGFPAWAVLLLAAVVGALWVSVILLAWAWLRAREKGEEEEKAFRELIAIFNSDIERLRRFLRI